VGEALIDDMSRIVAGDRFARAVAARLPTTVTVTAGEIAQDLSADDRHRISDVTVTRAAPPGADEAELARLETELAAVAEAVVAELQAEAPSWFARLGEDDVRLTITDGPSVRQLEPPLSERVGPLLRVALAALAGLGLAFLAHGLDPRLYTDEAAARAARAPVLGRLPRR
jgi:hypothetical protein